MEDYKDFKFNEREQTLKALPLLTQCLLSTEVSDQLEAQGYTVDVYKLAELHVKGFYEIVDGLATLQDEFRESRKRVAELESSNKRLAFLLGREAFVRKNIGNSAYTCTYVQYGDIYNLGVSDISAEDAIDQAIYNSETGP